MFQCKGNIFQCIPISWACDGAGDCIGSSDEVGCGMYTRRLFNIVITYISIINLFMPDG